MTRMAPRGCRPRLVRSGKRRVHMPDLEAAVAEEGPRSRTLAATIATAELRRRLTDPGLAIVDVRALSAYNGWRANGEARWGSHPGGRRISGRLADERR